jgi:hypothetical protein
MKIWIYILIILIVLLLIPLAQTLKGKKVKLKYDSFLKAYFKYIELNVLSWLSVILPFD